MPWKETVPMLERAHLLALHQQGLFSMTELSQRFGISRKTAYKWIARAQEPGEMALCDRSRRPHTSPGQTPEPVREALLQARREHPTWGPKKLVAYLKRRMPPLEMPAPSTVGALLKEHGLSAPRRRRSRSVLHPGPAPLRADAPNDTWCADFKGQFRTGDGRHCYPLTITDAHSRFLLCCHGLPSVEQVPAMEVFLRVFAQFGLPRAIRTDNGTPFSSNAICGLSRLSIWWIKLGIHPQRIEPGRPEQNGRHERMHRTLAAETARPPQRDHRAQQTRFDAFRGEFNQERPHEAIGQRTPASVYVPSARSLPSRAPDPCYPGHCKSVVVNKNGVLRLHKRPVFVSETLTGEYVGLEEIEDGIWSVYFYDVLLGRIDERDYKLRG